MFPSLSFHQSLSLFCLFVLAPAAEPVTGSNLDTQTLVIGLASGIVGLIIVFNIVACIIYKRKYLAR